MLTTRVPGILCIYFAVINRILIFKRRNKLTKNNSKNMKISISSLFFLLCMISLFSFSNHETSAKKGSTSISNFPDKITSRELNASLVHSLYVNLSLASRGLSEEIFSLAYNGFEKINKLGKLNTDSILTIIDFTKSSCKKRMFVLDLKSNEILFESVVAHGRNSGQEFAKSFSNKMNSHQSSLGFYITRNPYMGSNGYSLQLEGIEQGFNDKAMQRAIVIHGAEYANESFINSIGYLGRSFGCPALPNQINTKVINKIKQGTLLFAYFPDEKYLTSSEIING